VATVAPTQRRSSIQVLRPIRPISTR
jgi:hypothetical protein